MARSWEGVRWKEQRVPPLKSEGVGIRRVEMLDRVPVWVRRFVVWARSTGLKRVVYPGVSGAVGEYMSPSC